jgi:hypothetical protein
VSALTVFFIAQLALLAVGISIVVRVWKASALEGLLCLIVPLYVLWPMFKYAKDPDHDIRLLVAALFVLAIVSAWARYDVAHQVVAQAPARRVPAPTPGERPQAAQPNSDVITAEDIMDREVAIADDDRPSEDRRPQVSIEVGPRGGARRDEQPAPAAAPPAPASREPDSPVRALLPGENAPGAPPTARQAFAAATFQRGTFERSSLGFAIDLPGHFHALAAGDARRIETALNQPTDTHEIAWVMHEAVPLDAAQSWHVRVRWLSDGWVSGGALDAVRLLETAQQGKPAARLAGSGGVLIGYAVAPSMSGAVADWVEERLPAGSTASVLDCHAVRLGRKGIVEFSVVGAPAGVQQLCDASVRLLARNTRFESGADYTPAAGDAPRAPYTLAALISGAP